MKFSVPLLTIAAASTVLAAPAVVTVTEMAHQHTTKTVRGVVFVKDGQTQTSYTTLGNDAAPTTSSTANAIVQNENVDATTNKDTTTLQPTTSVAPVQAATTSTTPTQTAAQTSSAASTAGLSDFASSMLNEHNVKRALHQDTNALTWSDELAAYAQNYADNYDCSGNLVHSGGPYGENLALGYTAVGSVDAWYDEISQYDYANPGFSEATGHFTQVVWKGSTQVGCGIKTCGGVWGDYVICSYNPAGNVIGSFPENVAPLK
ncbi:Uncharacterized protein RNJ44_02836 [Nakaseomyces bracarensis]|uniref:SCP domain-containing protein n=1 Tax=Nakaseomyces bracarensis TaxID=273131 RepID=A0ABR4P0D4_9SACH